MMISIAPLTWKQSVRPILAGFVVGAVLLWVQNAFAATEQPLENMAKEAGTCARAIHIQEHRNAIPKGLLKALSFAESGRWYTPSETGRGEILAWPWTVTSGGKGHYLPSRSDAVAFVKSLQADGVTNIDVGCMQINLKYHPDAFTNLERAFDPETNAAYAANFLRERFATSKSWLQAAGDYHSTTPALNEEYRRKIVKLWKGAAPSEGTGIRMASLKTAQIYRETAQVYPTASLNKVPPYAHLPALDMARTRGFNKAFLKRRAAGGNAIVNRRNAMEYGTHVAQLSGSTHTVGFASKRRAQLRAWRQSRARSK